MFSCDTELKTLLQAHAHIESQVAEALRKWHEAIRELILAGEHWTTRISVSSRRHRTLSLGSLVRQSFYLILLVL